MDKDSLLNNLSLGKTTQYSAQYSPDLLQAVPRSLNRSELGINNSQPFKGVDVWHAYELSWLNSKGKPVVALARFTINASSPNIIESKSFKLYLNSLNQTAFESHDALAQTLIKDLSVIAESEVKLELFKPDNTEAFQVQNINGCCLDELDIEISNFVLQPDLLQVENDADFVEEQVHSHLLKSNCLITNQPDWATVIIRYSGKQINHESLLRYIISFREHNEFHEQCVERMFCDITKYCQPKTLAIQALYTRRGGLDINPYRSSEQGTDVETLRINRQ